ncbi:LysR family transcriptional regulator [Kiloniella spongiae]|uniref:LysR family transcriptional regulator n=1 Tax=Kiloniella spongiae TaxID=1489064 RepID=A0A0H2MGV0_9PROT|nr:LysR family transcriptional regulator [Kiloniella spongiae]KLN61618.1 LysR family transcriptional regulator [Kiloniella spongiae]
MESMNVIPVFVAVVEEGSFAGAARRIGVTKSAISKRISQLETHLGVQLLHRSTRKLSLSEAGEQYLAHAIQSLAAAQDAEDAVTQLQGAPQGRLRINTPMSFGRLHVAPLIPEFLSAYPGVEIDMVMDDRVVDMVEGGFDLAIRVRTLEDSALIARKLAPCHNLLCAAPRYLEKHGTPQKPENLRDHNCLQYAYASTIHTWQFEQANGETVSLETKGNYQVNNSEALREAIVAGIGIARLPTFIAGEEISAGRLVPLLVDYKLPSQTIYAVFPERRHLPAKVRVFVDFLVEKLGGDQPYWEYR